MLEAWNYMVCVSADAVIFKIIDEAIHDDLDALSLSISSDIPLFSDVNQLRRIPIASLKIFLLFVQQVMKPPSAEKSYQTQRHVLLCYENCFQKSKPNRPIGSISLTHYLR